MKKIASAFALLVTLAVTLVMFAQQTPRSETAGTSPKTTEVVAPDLSKLHPLTKQFFVNRGGRFDWVENKQDGDIQFVVLQDFSKDASSSEVIAFAIYAFDEKEPCAIVWKDGEYVRFAIVLENGKTVTTENGRVKFEPIRGDNDSVVGVRFFLYFGDNPNDMQSRVVQREFLMKQ